jgi:hypothetical protein
MEQFERTCDTTGCGQGRFRSRPDDVDVEQLVDDMLPQSARIPLTAIKCETVDFGRGAMLSIRREMPGLIVVLPVSWLSFTVSVSRDNSKSKGDRWMVYIEFWIKKVYCALKESERQRLYTKGRPKEGKWAVGHDREN